jgi:uncharacterized membrane protein YfcA
VLSTARVLPAAILPGHRAAQALQSIREFRTAFPRGNRGLPVRWPAIQALIAFGWKRAMDGTVLDLTLFLGATFVSALVAGLAGFAFGLVAAAVWLHILTPLQTATLIIGFGLVAQGYAVWTLRRAIDWNRLWPFLLGAGLGVPLGIVILGFADPAHVRMGVGVVLILFSVHGLARPAIKPISRGGAAADTAVGFLNGVLGGISGLAGILVVIWCGLRGWPKDQQRAVFQPVSVAIFAMSGALLGFRGAIPADTLRLFLFGLPVLLVGTWLGLRLYGRLDEAAFRRTVLLLLLASGLTLAV